MWRFVARTWQLGTKEERNFWRRKKRKSLFLLQKFQEGGNKEGENFVGMVEGKREISAGGQEIVGLLDTGSSHFLMKKEIFEKMEGKEVVTPTSYKGVEGGLVQQQKGKKQMIKPPQEKLTLNF